MIAIKFLNLAFFIYKHNLMVFNNIYKLKKILNVYQKTCMRISCLDGNKHGNNTNNNSLMKNRALIIFVTFERQEQLNRH